MKSLRIKKDGHECPLKHKKTTEYGEEKLYEYIIWAHLLICSTNSGYSYDQLDHLY